MIILNEQQEKIKNKAVEWFHHSSDQLFQIDGAAGTGKSVLIKAILDELHLDANQYYAMSYTGQAAIVMRTKGFRVARSIHSTLYEVVEVLDDGTEITEEYLQTNLAARFGVQRKRKVFRLVPYIDSSIRLFFIDEAYMVPKRMVQDIMSFGIKVIVAGDTHQLPPVGDDPGFLVSGKIHHLTQLMRQSENSPIIYIANRAMNNLPIHSGMYGNDVMVINDTDFIPQMIGFVDCILCGTNKTRELMNQYVRSLAGFHGNIPCANERIICRKNNWDLQINGIAIANGLSGTVLNNPDPSSFRGGDTFKINFKPDLTNDIFYGIDVCYKYFIAPFDEKQSMRNSFEMKWIQGELFDFAYALTTHLAQGAEYNNCLYIEELMRPNIQAQLNYTGITRARNKLIYIKKTRKFFEVPNF